VTKAWVAAPRRIRGIHWVTWLARLDADEYNRRVLDAQA